MILSFYHSCFSFFLPFPFPLFSSFFITFNSTPYSEISLLPIFVHIFTLLFFQSSIRSFVHHVPLYSIFRNAILLHSQCYTNKIPPASVILNIPHQFSSYLLYKCIPPTHSYSTFPLFNPSSCWLWHTVPYYAVLLQTNKRVCIE